MGSFDALKMLTKQAVEEFKEIYLKRYGVNLSESEATEIAHNLLNLYRNLYVEEPNMKSGS